MPILYSKRKKYLEIVLSFFGSEGTTVPQQVNKADGDATVNVEDQVILLGGSDALDGKSVVEELVSLEAFLDKFLNKLDTEIRVVARFDLVANTRDYIRDVRVKSLRRGYFGGTYSACSASSWYRQSPLG